MVEALQILAAQPRKPKRSHWKQNFGHASTVPINEVSNTEPLLQFKEKDVLVTKNGLGGFNLYSLKQIYSLLIFFENRMVVGIPMVLIEGENWPTESPPNR